MHTIRVSEDLNLGGGLNLKRGVPYAVDDINAGQLLCLQRPVETPRGKIPIGRLIRVTGPETNDRPLYARENYDGKHLLWVRGGGYGDLLFLTPTLREAKRLWPKCTISVSSFPEYADALKHNPDVDQMLDYPVSVPLYNSFEAQTWLENIIEGNPEAERVHAVDLMAKASGLAPEDRRMKLVLHPDEVRFAEETFPKKWRFRIGVHARASSPVRTYPQPLLQAAIEPLLHEGGEIFFFGGPGEVGCKEMERVVNLTRRDPPLTWRQSCAVLQTCDVLVAPDSSLTHVAGALGVPCVALYGPFPWKLRTAYAPKTHGLTGRASCAPCFHHSRPGFPWPMYGPCAKSNRCEAMAAIPPQDVTRAIRKLLRP